MNFTKTLQKARKIESSFAASFLWFSEERLNVQSEVAESTLEEDMEDHIDLIFKVELKVDVKGRKKIRRADAEYSDQYTYVEIKNVNGDKGWLYGKADFFAFEDENCFWLIARKVLQMIVEKNTIKKFTKEPEAWHCYKRSNRPKELTILVPFEQIKLWSEVAIPKKKNVIRTSK